MANTITEDQNKIAIDNVWDPMHNIAYSAVLEFSLDNLLDKIMCLYQLKQSLHHAPKLLPV